MKGVEWGGVGVKGGVGVRGEGAQHLALHLCEMGVRGGACGVGVWGAVRGVRGCGVGVGGVWGGGHPPSAPHSPQYLHPHLKQKPIRQSIALEG